MGGVGVTFTDISSGIHHRFNACAKSGQYWPNYSVEDTSKILNSKLHLHVFRNYLLLDKGASIDAVNFVWLMTCRSCGS